MAALTSPDWPLRFPWGAVVGSTQRAFILEERGQNQHALSCSGEQTMTGDAAGRQGAGAVRQSNAALDAELIDQLSRLLAKEASADHPPGEWDALQVAGHLTEFPAFFALDLRRWLADRSVTVGRTHENAARLAAVDHGALSQRDPDQLLGAVEQALIDLADALESVTDDDLDSTMRNIRYGEEPLRLFLDRYVLGHKAEHIAQLKSMRGQR